MSENNTLNNFFPFLGLDDTALIEIEDKIRPYLDKKSNNIDRDLQIRTLVYINFNKYLNLLMIEADEVAAQEVLDKFEETPISERLGLIARAVKQPKNKLITNFINLFNSRN